MASGKKLNIKIIILSLVSCLFLCSILIFAGLFSNRKVKVIDDNEYGRVVYTINTYDENIDDHNFIKLGEEINSNIIQYNDKNEAMTNFSNRPFYLRHIINNNVVVGSYVEFIIDNNTYAVKGNDSSYYDYNKDTLISAFGKDNCTIKTTNIHCKNDKLYANAYQNGYVEAGIDYVNCYVSHNGSSICSFGK